MYYKTTFKTALNQLRVYRDIGFYVFTHLTTVNSNVFTSIFDTNTTN